MASQVLYRKWRPQTLSEVVGQEPVTRTLLNALRTSRLAHAYLFCGPRGTGKTSTGRILAKAMNCLSPQEGEPCNACAMCQAVMEGRALDLVEIDGASNRGIEEIRDIRDRISFAPGMARYKVYIIDEVHMLTEPAFNALLKTLEEPPAHAVFILATTEVHKVPPTILSRCHRFDFRRVSGPALVGKLKQICEHEGISIEPQALSLIARAATGSLRDAENILEQVMLNHGNTVTVEQVSEELGVSDDDRVSQLAGHILGRDITRGLKTINSLAADGVDLRQFTRSLVEYLRKLLLLKAGAPEAADLPADEVGSIKDLVADHSLEGMSATIKAFAQIDFRAGPQSTLPLELALIDRASSPVSEARPTAAVEGKQEKPVAARQSRERSEPKEKARTKEAVGTTPVPDSSRPTKAPSEPTESESPPKGSPVAASSVSVPPPPHSVEQIREHWGEFVKACRGMGSSGNLDALLRSSCEVAGLEDNVLTLDFRYEWHKNKVEDPKYRHQVEVKLQEVFGAPYQVRCTQTQREEQKPRQRGHKAVVDAAVRMGATVIEEVPGDGE